MSAADAGVVIEQLRAELAASVPGLVVWQEKEPRRTRLIFPAGNGSDYRIVLFVGHGGGRAEVVAELVADPDRRFWRHRVRASRTGAEPLATRLLRIVVPLLAGPSRIRQTRGLLAWRFTCELKDGTLSVPGTRAPRLLRRVPSAPEGERVFRASGAKRRSG